MAGHVNEGQSVPLTLVGFLDAVEIDGLSPFKVGDVGYIADDLLYGAIVVELEKRVTKHPGT